MTPAGDPNDLEILLEADDLIPNSPTGEGDDLGGDSNESAKSSNGASAGGSNESSASLRFPSPPIDVSVQVIPDDNTNKGTAVLATALASAPIAPAPSADMGTHGKSPLPDTAARGRWRTCACFRVRLHQRANWRLPARQLAVGQHHQQSTVHEQPLGPLPLQGARPAPAQRPPSSSQ